MQDTKFLSHFTVVDNVIVREKKKRDRELEKCLNVTLRIYALLSLNSRMILFIKEFEFLWKND